jgi:hypothetical protein
MKRVLAAVVLMLGLSYCQRASEENGSRIVLPNPKLLRCKASDCYQVWLEKSAETNAVFPKQVTIDMNQSCLYGMTALCDRSAPLDDIRAAIDERYRKWAVPEFINSPLKIWRVEPEKFAIQLSVASKKDKTGNMADAGTKQAIYIAFGGRSACNTPEANGSVAERGWAGADRIFDFQLHARKSLLL